jgi:hypothetical protein
MKTLLPNWLSRWLAEKLFGVYYCTRCGQWTKTHHMRQTANGTPAGYWCLCSRPAQAPQEKN